jgi:hypothetical protein
MARSSKSMKRGGSIKPVGAGRSRTGIVSPTTSLGGLGLTGKRRAARSKRA